MKFDEWWKKTIEDNPLWKVSDENLNWRDVRVIAKLAYIEGEQEEFEKHFKKTICRLHQD